MIGRYAGGYIVEYKSPVTIFGLPLVHVAAGIDPVTMTPRVAKGIIAIGTIAVGVIAVGSVATGLIAVGGVALGLLTAVGAVAMGAGLSVGGVAFGAVAIGGVAFGVTSSVGALTRLTR